MITKMHSVSTNPSQPAVVNPHFTPDEVNELVAKISGIYTSLEYIIMKDGMKLHDSSKANMRRSQAEIQKIRLKLLDSLQDKTEDSLRNVENPSFALKKSY